MIRSSAIQISVDLVHREMKPCLRKEYLSRDLHEKLRLIRRPRDEHGAGQEKTLPY